jgi:hypothetical protein
VGLIFGDFTRMEGGTNLLRGCVSRTFFHNRLSQCCYMVCRFLCNFIVMLSNDACKVP